MRVWTPRLAQRVSVPESELRKAIRADNLDRYLEGLQAWLRFVYRHGVVEIDARDASRSLIRPDFIDCLPRNLILGEDGLTLIDREWEYRGRCSAAVLLMVCLTGAAPQPR